MNFDYRPSVHIAGGFFSYSTLRNFILFSSILLLLLPSQAHAFGIAKIKAKVVDESG